MSSEDREKSSITPESRVSFGFLAAFAIPAMAFAASWFQVNLQIQDIRANQVDRTELSIRLDRLEREQVTRYDIEEQLSKLEAKLTDRWTGEMMIEWARLLQQEEDRKRPEDGFDVPSASRIQREEYNHGGESVLEEER